MDAYAVERKRMVERQLAARGIRNPRVLAAFEEVPRHLFVPENLQGEAYEDNPLPIGDGQTISQPYMVAIMTELLAPEATDRILEIGTGSGYQVAILSRLCKYVYTVERIAELATRAENILQQCGYENVSFLIGDGTAGWPAEAPYEGIIVTAGAPSVPKVLVDQLVEGGRLIIPVGDRYSQVLQRIIRTPHRPKVESYTGCRFVDLVGEYGWRS